jgi:hypothetical protein
MAPKDRGAVVAGAKKGNSTCAAQRELIALPKWLPPSVEKQVREIEQRSLTAEQCAILRRLATDGRMRRVWTQFLRIDRKSGLLESPAKPLDDFTAPTQDEIQAEAIGEIFHFVFCAARDQKKTIKAGVLAGEKANFLQYAQLLMEVAEYLVVHNPDDQQAINDAAALFRVAGWLKASAAALLTPSDPLSIKNNRGNPVVRGVQIVIAAQLLKVFGKRFDRTAATLTSVALDKKTSERVTRSAFSRQKPTEKGGLLKPRRRE